MTTGYFLSDFLDFLYPPCLLQPSSRRRLEKVGRVEKVEKVGEEVGTSRRKFEKVQGTSKTKLGKAIQSRTNVGKCRKRSEHV